jgi:glycosyltransferase involved in cell wall biosynthesis
MISSVSVIVPAYNEAAIIEVTLREALAYFRAKPYDFEIIVVADGNDGTRELVGKLALREPRVRVIGDAQRRGKGRGVREGIALAHGDVIGFIDADNKSPISEFDKFEQRFEEGADVVIGSRAMRESQIERYQVWYRRLGSKAFAIGMHAVVGLHDIADTQCGFKFFRRDAALDIFGRQQIDGYMFDVEILHLATRSAYRIAQVPVRWCDDGDSRLQLVRGNLRNFKDILRIGWSRLRTTWPSRTVTEPTNVLISDNADHQLRLLLVSINYAPEQTGFAQHVTALAESLVRRGHVVTVLTGFPFAPQWRRWPEYHGRAITREDVNGVEVIRLAHFIPSRPGHLLRRVWMEMSFSLIAGPALAWSRQAPWNLIVYYGAQPSLAMFARMLAWWKRVPYVVSIQDLAAQAASDVGIARHPLISKLMQRFEYSTYRNASRALVLCEAFKDALVSNGYNAGRIHVIPSPIDVDRVRPVAPSTRFREANGLAADDFVVLYSGSMGLKQGLINVIEASRETAKKAPNVKWVLVGDGEVKSTLQQLIHRHALGEFVKMLSLHPEEEMPMMFASADLLLLNQVGAVKTTVIPSKLLTYMSAGKPVLAAVNPGSQGAELLRRATGGMIINADDSQALAAAVLELRNRDCGELLDMGRRNRTFAEQHFDSKRILAAQEALLVDVAFRSNLASPAVGARPA